MSAFHEDTRNLSAVLDSLLSGVCVVLQPLPRFDGGRRRPAARMDEEFFAQSRTRSQKSPVKPVQLVFNISAHTRLTVEMLYDQ